MKNWIALMLLGASACASQGDEAKLTGDSDYEPGAQNNANNTSANNSNNFNEGDGNSSNNGNVFVPEIEDEYEFSAPAVVGDRVFVANETLNSVAVIHSDTLRVENVPVGFMPSAVVGPRDADSGNVWVLNGGSSTVTRIDAQTLKTQTYRVLRRANRIATSGNAGWAFAWFDLENHEGIVPPEVDFASVTALSEAGAFQIAVGFNVREVRFSDDGAFALVVTDDGISRIDLAALTGDGIVPPIRLAEAAPEDQEVVTDPTGRWAVARANTQSALTLVDLANDEHILVALPEIPTDLDWVRGGKVLVSLPRTGNHFLATVPDGLLNLAAAAPVEEVPDQDAGMDAGDAGDAGLDAGDAGDAGLDAGDAGDAGLDAGDVGIDGGDVGPEPWGRDIEGVTTLDLELPLGAAEVAPEGNVALFFSTLNDERRGILWDFEKQAQDRVDFEKGVKGAVADTLGRAFVVLHSRVEQPIPVGATPLDPEYIERSWAISLLDVASGASRLILTSHEAGRSVLWSDEEGLVKLYLGFRVPQDEFRRVDTQRDVLVANLGTFATQTFRLASYPEGLGLVGPARRVYISQIHPQGRMTFVDVDTDERQTVTGYQLNSGID